MRSYGSLLPIAGHLEGQGRSTATRGLGETPAVGLGVSTGHRCGVSFWMLLTTVPSLRGRVSIVTWARWHHLWTPVCFTPAIPGVAQENPVQKQKKSALAGEAPWVGRHPAKRKVVGLILSQGTCLGRGFGPSLSPSLPLSLKKKKVK